MTARRACARRERQNPRASPSRCFGWNPSSIRSRAVKAIIRGSAACAPTTARPRTGRAQVGTQRPRT
eukprot:5040191-Alexandrium_andersonii.AAC.1